MAGVLAASLPAGATEVPTAGDTIASDESKDTPPDEDGRRTLGRLPANLGRGAVGVFNKDNLVPFLAGGAATGAASFFDDDVKNAVSDPDSGFGKALETAGAWPVAAVVAGAFTAGRFTHGTRFRAMSYDLLNAAVINLAYTELLKVTVRRERPDGSNNQSFPSGHSSDAFTWATVFERHYGWKLGVPAYALAATMGYSRIVRDKHYLSDVVAGATLGYIVGRTVVRVNSLPLAKAGGEKTLSLSPIVGRHARGLRVSMAF
jgi:membrane-associated phospholipid phosphatase